MVKKLLILLFSIVTACVFVCASDCMLSEKVLLKEPDLMTHSMECSCDGKNALEFTSLYFKVADTIGRDGFFATQQQMKLRMDGRIYPVENPATNKEYVLINNDSVHILSTTLRKVKCVKKDNDFVYSIYGSNSTDPPHEFFGVLSRSGKWLWYYYGNTNEIFKRHGKLKRITSKYPKDEIRSLKNMVDVLPAN